MALKTFVEVEEKIASLGLGLIRTQEGEQVVYRYPNGARFVSIQHGREGTFPFTLPMAAEAMSKYRTVTGHSFIDNSVDLLWHLLDNFQELSSFTTLRARIKDPATCGSFATTIAVNKYIAENNSHEDTIKELFSGSKWRWKKVATGEYIQQTLYSMHSDSLTTFAAYNNQFFVDPHRLSSVADYANRVRRQIAMQERERIRQEEVARQAEEERATTLLSYGTRATEFFEFKKGTDAKYNTFLGVELELENHSKREYASLNTIKDHAIFKRDGSLDNGVEICTAPATLDVHKEAFAKFFTALEENTSDLEAKSSCGMHVHIDRSKLTTLHVANLCLLLNKEENDVFIRAIAGRSANSYCKLVKQDYGTFTSNERGDRYQRVNLTPAKTVELRMFASTTNYKDFCKRLEFTQAVVDYTRPGETNITCKDIPKWENFKGYVMKHRNIYPTLVKEI